MNTETKTMHDDYCFICERAVNHIGEHDDVDDAAEFTDTQVHDGITVYVTRVY